ncbi:capsule assembly Wzi family protein [Vitreoscilla stercoraria]|uniref:Capsule assembly Wzi family protein n=1 Tax=Vitreoscilla stercoraria TaxID=61 RepID=A0ABY4EAB2_VITST|nr:capsule assembly Wzi family protein [Vitreoscilla stercoraria]UOO92387.1 capsule assembly Wzi family protein [Vitreoscilla stercoraria]
MQHWLRTLLASSLALVGAQALANGMVLPDEQLQQDLSWLSNRGVINLSLSTWPMSGEEVQIALSDAKPQTTQDQLMIDQVRNRLNALKSNFVVEAQSATGFNPLGQGLGDTTTDQHRFSAIAQYQNQYVDVRLQGNAVGGEGVDRSSHGNLNGSYGAVKLGNQWLSFGQQQRWWGPGKEGSLIMGHTARPVTGFALQRAEQTPFESPWLSWLGRWQYQLTAGQLAHYDAVPDAKLIGMRVNIQPTDYLELGASRAMQWGGEGRPQSAKSFWNGLIGKGDNTYTAAEKSQEPGNQLGGFEAKLKLQPLIGLPVSIYGQAIGEDEAGGLPSKNTYLLGVEGSHAMGNNAVNWYVEGADTTTSLGSKEGITYNHHIYRNGYYQQGAPLGYALGGDAKTVTTKVTFSTPDQQRLSGKVTYAEVNPTDHANNRILSYADKMAMLEVGYGKTFKNGLNVDSTVWYNHAADVSTYDGAGVGVKLSMPFK